MSVVPSCLGMIRVVTRKMLSPADNVPAKMPQDSMPLQGASGAPETTRYRGMYNKYTNDGSNANSEPMSIAQRTAAKPKAGAKTAQPPNRPV